jgi:hypothetical protein
MSLNAAGRAGPLNPFLPEHQDFMHKEYKSDSVIFRNDEDFCAKQRMIIADCAFPA